MQAAVKLFSTLTITHYSMHYSEAGLLSIYRDLLRFDTMISNQPFKLPDKQAFRMLIIVNSVIYCKYQITTATRRYRLFFPFLTSQLHRVVTIYEVANIKMATTSTHWHCD